MTQRTIFTSTPRKRTYLWDTGQRVLETQKSKTKNLSEVNTAASRIYRVVLWTSQDISRSSKKKKTSWSTQKTSKKKQKETELFNSQNLDKYNSSQSGVSENSQKKAVANLGDEKENKKHKVKNEKKQEKRAKCKLQVNKEIQRLFSEKFSDDKRKNEKHLQNINTLELSNLEDHSKIIQVRKDNETDKNEHFHQNKLYPQKKSAAVNTCSHDDIMKNCDQNYKNISRDAQMNNKDKWEDDIFFKSSVDNGEDGEHLINNTDGHLLIKNNVGCLGNNNHSNQNENDMFDIWSLSKDSGQDNDQKLNQQIGRTRLQRLKKNMSNEKVTITKVVPTRKKDYSNFSKNESFKKKDSLAKNSSSENKCYFQAKHSTSVTATTQPDSMIRTSQTVKNSQMFPSSYAHSSQVYDFPKSPKSTGKEQLKAKVVKKSSKLKENLKNVKYFTYSFYWLIATEQ